MVRTKKRHFNGRAKSTSIMVDCKCPYCWKMHKVPMINKPIIMPRIYCNTHDQLRYKPEYGFRQNDFGRG